MRRAGEAVSPDELVRGEESQDAIAEKFGVHPSTADKWWHRWRTTDSCAALPHASGPARTLQDCEKLLRAEVKKQPDVTLAELCERVAKTKNVSASPSMMCREMKILELPLKKSHFTTANKKRPA